MAEEQTEKKDEGAKRAVHTYPLIRVSVHVNLCERWTCSWSEGISLNMPVDILMNELDKWLTVILL